MSPNIPFVVLDGAEFQHLRDTQAGILLIRNHNPKFLLHSSAPSLHYMGPVDHPPITKPQQNDAAPSLPLFFSERGEILQMKNLGRKIGGLALTLAFVFGISIAASLTAHAQYRNDDGRYDDGRYQRDRDGKKAKKWKKRHDNDSESREWRRAEQRNRAYDNRRDGRYENNGRYNRNGGYGNNGSYGNNDGYNNRNQVELNQGYQVGLNTGASDGQRGQSYNPQRSRNYKNASTQAFREGFVRGYDEGYRQYSNGNRRSQSSNGMGDILGGILGRP